MVVLDLVFYFLILMYYSEMIRFTRTAVLKPDNFFITLVTTETKEKVYATKNFDFQGGKWFELELLLLIDQIKHQDSVQIQKYLKFLS